MTLSPTPSQEVPVPALRRALTLPLLTLYGLGVTVGAGIYVLIGATAAAAGPYAPVAFAVAALVVGFSAFSYAELATRYPVSAGEAAYMEAGFGRAWLTTGVGLLVASAGIVSASAVAIGAASYLGGLTGWPEAVLTLAIVGAMGAIAGWGIAQSVTVAAVITVIEIAGLTFVIGWGFGVAEPAGAPLAHMVPPLVGPHWAGIGAAALLAFFAFVGFEDMANVAEEVRDPVRTLPRAIAWTLGSATLLYLAVAAAVLHAVPLEALAGAAAPLSLVFAEAPVAVQSTFAAIAVVATVNGVLIQMIMASRVLYGLADQGRLPGWLGRVGARTRTPVNATLAVTAIIAGLTLAFPIAALAERTSQIVLVVFILVNLALIRLKWRGSEAEGPHFRVPLAVPVLGALTSIALLAAAIL